MAIQFLNSINLNDNHLENAKVHVTSTTPAAEKGQIYLDSTAGVNKLKYHDGSNWITLEASTGGTVTSVTSGDTNTITIGGTAADPTVAANTAAVTNGSSNLATGDQIYDFVIGLGYTTNVGDITRVNITAGDGLTGTVDTTSGDHTQTINVVGGDGITANADEIEVSVDDTTIELSASDGTGVVRAKTAAITDGGTGLATGDQIYDFVIGQNYITGNETITLSGDVSGTGTTSIIVTINSDAVEAGMLNDNIISGQTPLTTGLASTDEFLVSDAGVIKRMDVSVLETYMQNNLTFTTNTNTTYDLSVQAGGANTSVIRLAGSDSTNDDVTISGTSTTVEVTESGDTIILDLQDDVTIVNDLTVGGDINVTGSLNSYTTSELLVQDQYITLNSGQTSGVLDAFVKVERGTTDVALKWNESTDRWQFTNDGSTYYNIPISSEYDNFNFNLQVGGTSQEVADGGTVTFAQGGGLSVAISGNDTITYSHTDTSSVSDTSNSGLTVIQDLTFDTYGHVTGVASSDITSEVVSEITNRQIALLIGNGSAKSIDLVNSGATAPDVNHGLGTDSSQFMIQLIDASTGETVYSDVTRGANGLVTIDFATAPSTNGIRVLVQQIN